MSRSVNLLLLLSALLSALTGIGGGSRHVQAVPAAMAQPTQVAAVPAARRATTPPAMVPRPVPGWSIMPVPRAFALAPAAPLYLLRRRE